MIAKLSGFAKFDLDLKLTCDQFLTLVTNFSSTDAGACNEEKFEEIMDVMEKAYAEGATPPYTGDLENETYKTIIQTIRDLNT